MNWFLTDTAIVPLISLGVTGIAFVMYLFSVAREVRQQSDRLDKIEQQLAQLRHRIELGESEKLS